MISVGESVPALAIDNLSVGYKSSAFQKARQVVHGLSFTVAPGEVIGFLGPNGAGKSSTIKAIMGFVNPSAGSARIFGHEAGSLQARERIGYLPEVALYYPFLTPMETLWLYGTLQGIGRRELKAQSLDLLKRVGLEGFEKKQLKTFSKGMQQRLGIAQALLGAPKLLILDEVTSGVDPLGRRQLRELLSEVRRSGTTIFFSSHELDEVAQLCDRVLLVHGGRLIEERVMDERLRSGIGSALEDYFVTTMERAALLQKAA